MKKRGFFMQKKLAAALEKRKHKKGFTLVELVIVIAVLGIIAGIAIPTVHSVVDNANAAADQSNAQAVELAIKTVASELKSGQTVYEPGSTTKTLDWSSANVGDALQLNGLGSDLPTVKEGSSYTYRYDGNGKITVTKDTAGTALKNTTALQDVLPNS